MTLRVGLINGTNINQDYDFGFLLKALSDGGVVEGLEVQSGKVTAGIGFIPCERTNGNRPFVLVELTDDYTIDTTGTKKVWIVVSQAKLDDGSSNNEDGTGIATIETGASYPAGNYIPLASITSGTITDERETVKVKSDKFEFDKSIRDLSDVYNFTNPTVKKFLIRDINTGKINIGDVETTDVPQSSTLVNEDYLAGEDITQGNSLFVEEGVTFASATNYQNIGDATANTRVAIKALGSGIAGNSIKLALAKATSPSVNLNFRLETDNAGSPSGTLVDPNAIGSIDPANLSTSLAEKDISISGSTVSNSHGVTLNNNETGQTAYKGIKFTLTSQVSCVSVEKISACTATKAYLYDTSGNLLASASFSGNTATINYGSLVNGNSYYILAGSDGSSYTSVKQTGSASFPYNSTKINFVGGIAKGNFTDNSGYGYSLNSGPSGNYGIKFSVKSPCNLTSVNITETFLTATVRLLDEGGNTLASASSSGGVATFTPYALSVGVNYRIEVIGFSSFNQAGSSVVEGNVISFLKGSVNGSDNNSYVYNIVSISTSGGIAQTTDVNNIVSVVTGEPITISKGTVCRLVLFAGTYGSETVNGTNYYKIGYGSNNTTTRYGKLWNGSVYGSADSKLYYQSSNLLESSLLSKTDADYTYKLPDIPRIATANYSTGDLVKYDFQGITKALSGLTANALYYISNTPGALSTSAGTNTKPIGLASTTDQLNLLDDGYLGTATLNNGQQTYSVPVGCYRIECYVVNYTDAGSRYQEGFGVITPYKNSFTLREAESNSTTNAFTTVTLASGIVTLTATTIANSSAILKFYNK